MLEVVIISPPLFFYLINASFGYSINKLIISMMLFGCVI